MFPGIPNPHRQNRKRTMSIVLMVNFTHISKKYDKPVLYSLLFILLMNLYSLLSYIRGKVRNLVCITSKQKIF